MAQEFDLQVKLAGNRQILPGFLIEKINHIETETAINKGRRLNLLIAYNPVQEVIEAMQTETLSVSLNVCGLPNPSI